MKFSKFLSGIVVGALAVSMMAVTAVAADDGVIYGIETFDGLSISSDGQYVDGYGIQRMSWNNAAYGNFTGSKVEIVDGALVVTGGQTAKGFQIQNVHSAHTLSLPKTVGNEYKVVMEVAAVDTDGIINIVPDNHPDGVAKTFDLTTEKTTFENTWTLVLHQYNDLQISSDVDFIVYSIAIYDTALMPAGADDADDADADDADDADADDADDADDEVDATVDDADDDVSVDDADDDATADDAAADDAADTSADTATATTTTTTATTTGDTTAATDADKGADTGVQGVAAIAGLAILATGAVIISRKK